MKKQFKSLRWILLAAGIVAVISITAMNVYSLYSLRNYSVKSALQSRKIELAEFSDKVQHRFFTPFNGLQTQQINKEQQTFNSTGQFSKKMQHVMYHASKDSIFDDIYYIPATSTPCKSKTKLLQFKAASQSFEKTTPPNEKMCDALGIARTRMHSLIRSYRFNNKVLFDTHHSMIIALVNQLKHSVIGYFIMPINRRYLIHEYLLPRLQQQFGPNSKSSLTVWLRNWTTGKVIAGSNPQVKFASNKIEIRQKFSDFFDDWALYASIDKGNLVAAYAPPLWRNLLILGAAFIILVGAMLFMFFTARRERSLAQRQSDFLANVTHELKTPITVMQAAGENLADGRIQNRERIKSYGSHIHREALRLQNMINQLLEVARADAGQAFIHPKPLALDKKIEAFLKYRRDAIQEKGFTFDVSLAKNPSPVMLDENSLETILSNLVNNALKYCNGNKYLGISLSENEGMVVLKIKDQGVGMPKHVVDHIFEKFYRAENSLSAKTKGYGLGLSIVKNLVNLNGGTISVKSRRGTGTIFTIMFPAIPKKERLKHKSKAISSNPLASQAT